jgi:hypothetical protein
MPMMAPAERDEAALVGQAGLCGTMAHSVPATSARACRALVRAL